MNGGGLLWYDITSRKRFNVKSHLKGRDGGGCGSNGCWKEIWQ